MTKFGKMHKPGEVVLAMMQFTDTFEVKKRPAVILFEEKGNVVVAGITSNRNMSGIFLSKKEGAVRDSVIKLNYIFTITEKMIVKKLFDLTEDKKKIIYNQFTHRLKAIRSC